MLARQARPSGIEQVADPCIGVMVEYVAAEPVRGILDDDEFPVLEGLGKQALDGRGEESWVRAIHRHDDGHSRHGLGHDRKGGYGAAMTRHARNRFPELRLSSVSRH